MILVAVSVAGLLATIVLVLLVVGAVVLDWLARRPLTPTDECARVDEDLDRLADAERLARVRARLDRAGAGADRVWPVQGAADEMGRSDGLGRAA